MSRTSMGKGIEDVTAALLSAQVSLSGVSFEGKSLKLDNAEDGKHCLCVFQKSRTPCPLFWIFCSPTFSS